MPLPGLMRIMMYQRMALIPPLYVQCFTCIDNSSVSSTTGAFEFLSLSKLPTKSDIKDLVQNSLSINKEFSSELVFGNAGEKQEGDLRAIENDKNLNAGSAVEKVDGSHFQSERQDPNSNSTQVLIGNSTDPTMHIEPGDSAIMASDSTVPTMPIDPAETPVMPSQSTEDPSVLHSSSTVTAELPAVTSDSNSTASTVPTDPADPPIRHSEDSPILGSNSTATTELPAVTLDSNSSAPSTQIEPVEPPVEEPMFKHEGMTPQEISDAKEVEKLMRKIRDSALPPHQSNRASVIQPKDKPLYMRDGTPQGTMDSELPSCEGRYIYIYDLPSRFNEDLLEQCDALHRWMNLCDYFQNQGMGVVLEKSPKKRKEVLIPDGSWYLTYKYTLELIFHARMKDYECLTTDQSEASLFYIPYYGALDVNHWEFAENATNVLRDVLAWDLVHWLEEQDPWKRSNGLDHVLLLGEISWDFRRQNDDDKWGSRLLELPQLSHVTKLLLERQPWELNDIGVPYPTSFHPNSDNDIVAWQSHCEKSQRRYLVSLAGYPKHELSGSVGEALIKQCLDNRNDCHFLKCEKGVCHRPDTTMDLFLHSHFCMQPPGHNPTRRSVFDSLIGGCIPVLFDTFTAYYQYPWHLPEDANSFSVYIPSEHVRTGKANIVEILKKISGEERAAIRARIINDILPGLVYSKPGSKHPSFRDAFDISIEGLLQRVANLRAEKAADATSNS
ncbi:hypothetical protein R1sor_023444 [Riccia sorocarpa]|uniref:Exostosin GT47 domain-containing protein n=1 Tax=Riccia sorocarpa TaxID=122646 RepID=A0ABD3GMS5_9MARC